MQAFRKLCLWVCVIGVLQAAAWTRYTFEAATADQRSLAMRTYGVAWSPWLTLTCGAPLERPDSACPRWDFDLHPLSGSIALLALGIAAGLVARRLGAPVPRR